MKTIVFQIKTRGEILDGMSYVIRCGDGSTLVVDGGMPGDGKILVDLLKKIADTEKPVIDAWFFTHNHLDHTGAFFDVAEKFSDQVRVKKIVHRFLSEEFYANCQPACVPELKRFTDDFGFFPGVEIVTPLAGDEFRFGSVKIEILYTSADLPIVDGGKKNFVNDTSLVFRLIADSQSVLFTGDVQKAAERVLIEKYGAALKSDVCQISHHVDLRSDTKFFSYVDPEIVLWPTGSLEPKLSLTMLLTSCDPDRTLMYDLHVRDVFIAGFGTVSLEMPIRPSVAPFFGGSIERLKNCEPEGEIAYRPYTENLSVSDPVWDSLSAVDLDYPMGLTSVRASVKFFWSEKGIGVKTSVCGMDAPAPS
ncbi:MAG: MBL fold metallo-hydrolase, partial [Clostridia bacterium]|nr:MBL fold metallo-hydrolase [Clostridia bacterium]